MWCDCKVSNIFSCFLFVCLFVFVFVLLIIGVFISLVFDDEGK